MVMLVNLITDALVSRFQFILRTAEPRSRVTRRKEQYFEVEKSWEPNEISLLFFSFPFLHIIGVTEQEIFDLGLNFSFSVRARRR